MTQPAGPRPIPPSRIYRRRPWIAAPLAAVDFEATGLDPSKDSIVSYGVVPVDHGQIDLSRAVYEEVVPEAPLSYASIEIHELRPLDLASGIALQQAAASLREALDRRYLLTWVAAVEVGFLGALFGRRRAWAHRTIDVAVLAAVYERLEGGRDAARPRTLAAAAERHGVPVEAPHHALDDAVMTAELFLVLATKLAPHGFGQLSSYLRPRDGSPLPR
jgi:DNA polymerase-3 subunit epsilon